MIAVSATRSFNFQGPSEAGNSHDNATRQNLLKNKVFVARWRDREIPWGDRKYFVAIEVLSGVIC